VYYKIPIEWRLQVNQIKMENWIILGKLGILVYCCIKYVEGPMENTAAVIFFILTYVIFNMLAYVLKPLLWKRIMFILSIVLLLFCSVYVNPLFVLFLPMGVSDVVHCTVNDMRFVMVALLVY